MYTIIYCLITYGYTGHIFNAVSAREGIHTPPGQGATAPVSVLL